MRPDSVPELCLNGPTLHACFYRRVLHTTTAARHHSGPTNSDKRYARVSTVERTLLTALTRPKSGIIPYRALSVVARWNADKAISGGAQPHQPSRADSAPTGFSTTGSSTIRLNHLHHSGSLYAVTLEFLYSVPKHSLGARFLDQDSGYERSLIQRLNL